MKFFRKKEIEMSNDDKEVLLLFNAIKNGISQITTVKSDSGNNKYIASKTYNFMIVLRRNIYTDHKPCVFTYYNNADVHEQTEDTRSATSFGDLLHPSEKVYGMIKNYCEIILETELIDFDTDIYNGYIYKTKEEFLETLPDYLLYR